MRILGYECKKICRPWILLLIVIFTILYYQMFLLLPIHPAGGMVTDSQYDIPFAGELVKEIGPVINKEDWDKIKDIKKHLISQMDKIISSNSLLTEHGIHDYETFDKTWNNTEKDEEKTTKEEKAVLDELSRMWFYDSAASKCLFQLQYLDTISGYRDSTEFGMDKGEIKKYLAEKKKQGATDLYLHTEEKRCALPYMSLLPEGVSYILTSDMKHLSILMLITCLALIIPYQIHERLRGVLPLYAATHTGRKIFSRQYLACAVTSGILCLVHLAVYLGYFACKGLAVFWQCPAWTSSRNTCWFEWGFGAYTFVHALLVWLFVIAAIPFGYLVGRAVDNYVLGIALSIPLGVAFCLVSNYLFGELFWFLETTRLPYWELFFIAAWIAVSSILIYRTFHEDRRRAL